MLLESRTEHSRHYCYSWLACVFPSSIQNGRPNLYEASARLHERALGVGPMIPQTVQLFLLLFNGRSFSLLPPAIIKPTKARGGHLPQSRKNCSNLFNLATAAKALFPNELSPLSRRFVGISIFHKRPQALDKGGRFRFPARSEKCHYFRALQSF